MSDVMRRVVTLFEARGAEQIRAAMGTMTSSFAQGRRELDLTGRSSGYVNNQLRALGTTLRYTFAGTTIFGTMQLIRNLGQFQAQLGEISAIATGPGGLPVVGQQLDDLGSRLLDISNKTTQPISDLESGVLSLYSTIGNVPENEAANMMEDISKVAITSQSNIEDTTQALLGMLNAFGRGPGDLRKFGDEFQKVIQLSAGMPGSVYAGKLGVLSASAAISRFTPEQMGALAISATRGGGSPNTNMTYLAQFLTYLTHPTTAKEKAAFASIGLGQRELATLPGEQILNTVLNAINARGGVGISASLANANDDTLNQLEQLGVTGTQAGIRGGGGQLLQSLFGRIQSQRMGAILSRLVSPTQTAGTKNQTIDQYLQQVANSAGSVDRAMGRAMDYRRIQQAGNAMHNFGIELGTALSPLLQYPARGITALSTGFNRQHWGVGPVSGQQLEIGAGAVGVLGLLRTLSRGGRGVNAIRGVGMLGAGADLLTEHQRGYTPANPLYVAVVYSLSGFPGRPGNAPTGTGPFGVPGGRIGPPEAPGGAAGRLGRLGRLGRFGRIGAIAGGAAAGLLAPVAFGLAQSGESQGGSHVDPVTGHWIGYFNGQKIVGPKASDRYINAAREQANAAYHQQVTQVQGKAEITIKDERTKKIHHVTTDLFPDFSAPVPQVKGKDRTYRGGR